MNRGALLGLRLVGKEAPAAGEPAFERTYDFFSLAFTFFAAGFLISPQAT
jgi:hypothetical protein